MNVATYACPSEDCALWREPVEMPVPGPGAPGLLQLVTWTCKGCGTVMERVDPNRMIVVSG